MTNNPGGFRRKFHEMPLVLFTTLAMTAGGIGIGRLALAALGAGGWGATAGEAAAVGGLLALGIAFSTFHLGRPSRAGLALRRAGRSPLSNEVVVTGLTVVTGVVVVVFPEGQAVARFTSILLPLLAALVLLTLGLVYRLPGQLAWPNLAVASPVVLGTVFGLVLHWGWGTWEGGGTVLVVLLAFWMLDLVVTVARGIGLEKAGKLGEPSYADFFSHRRASLGARILFVNILPPLALLMGWVPLAVPLLGVGILLDRLAFYGLSVERTTESEVERVEAVIAGMGGMAE